MRQKQRVFSLFLLSPSSRRAWIEILYRHRKDNINAVALLAEGVDRNCFLVSVPDRLKTSPSSRRAWIEIASLMQKAPAGLVALLAEGVDRNVTRPNA